MVSMSFSECSPAPHEQADFSLANNDVLERLSAAFVKWDQQMLPRLTRES
jgi:hypothetical protein